MEFKCDQGHTVVAPWKKIREHRECPICSQGLNQVKSFHNTKKKKDEYRVLAFDQATHVSGFSLFSNKNLIDYGIFEAHGDEAERLCQVKQWMVSLINNYDPDFVGFEGIQYQANSGVTTFQALARLQGVLMETCYELKIPFEIVNTNTWREAVKVTGRTRTDKKRSMQLRAKELYNVKATEDETDAIGIGKYFSDIKGNTSWFGE